MHLGLWIIAACISAELPAANTPVCQTDVARGRVDILLGCCPKVAIATVSLELSEKTVSPCSVCCQRTIFAGEYHCDCQAR